MFNFMRWGIPLLFLCGLLPCLCADAIGQVAPYVKKMIPENGAEDVKSNLKEIVITFSEPMMDRSWSITGSGENFPEIK
ncbi:MAG: Ig-like domain-containing protein, partial [Planctomycetota bacterium]